MRVIIAGGRYFADYALLREKCDFYLQDRQGEEIEIVSGAAKGADALGEQYAHEKGYKVKQFPADWDTFGKSAGIKRNAQMAEYADALIAFWDGKSRGTKNMIDTARKKGLTVRVIRYDGGTNT